MQNKFVKKLTNQAGSSLVEMLATVILVGLMGITITSGIGAVQSAYDKVVRKANEQVLLSTTLTEMKDWIRYSIDYDADKGLFQSKDGYWFKFQNANGNDEKGIQIAFYSTKTSTKEYDHRSLVPDANGAISNVYSSFKDEGSAVTKSGNKFVISGLHVGKNNTDGVDRETSYVTPIIQKVGG